MSENIVDRSILTDAVISLANTFKEAGSNPPIMIQVDKNTFDKLLAESVKLYNIDTKKAITERKFSLVDIIMIAEEQSIKSREDKQEQSQELTITKYKCPDCQAVFDTRQAHRKHHQAFHDNIKEPEEIKQQQSA
jgi:hypothetical protein